MLGSKNNSLTYNERDVGYIFIEEAESMQKEIFLSKEDEANDDTPLRKPPLKTPNAPIKQCNKKLEKIQIRPKKLIYVEEEINQDNKQSKLSFSRNLPNRKAKIKMTSYKENIFVADKSNKEGNSRKNNKKSKLPKSLPCKEFNPNACISQVQDDTSNEEKLLWLHPRHDVGMWIECCNPKCKKMRFSDDYHDPVDVPEIWYCKMNSDKQIASCSIPEVPIDPLIDKDLIENKYNAGSIVWARVKSCPWFPAMVDDCIDTMSFELSRKNSIIPFKYHVIFLQDDIKTSWVTLKNIKPFVHHRKEDLVKRFKYLNVDYRPLLNRACEFASMATKISILKRLQKFSWVARKNNRNTHLSNNDNENQMQCLNKTNTKDTTNNNTNTSNQKLMNVGNSLSSNTSLDRTLGEDSYSKEFQLDDIDDFIPGTPERKNENVEKMKLIIQYLNETINLKDSITSKYSKDSVLSLTFENGSFSLNTDTYYPQNFKSNPSSKRLIPIENDDPIQRSFKKTKFDDIKGKYLTK